MEIITCLFLKSVQSLWLTFKIIRTHAGKPETLLSITRRTGKQLGEQLIQHIEGHCVSHFYCNNPVYK